MSNPIKHIIESIDTSLEAAITFSGVCFWGITELVEKNAKTYPVPERQNKTEIIFIDAKKPLQLYWRINSISEGISPNGFGKELQKRTTGSVSLFGIGQQSVLVKQFKGANVDIAYAIYAKLPEVPFNADDNIPFAYIDSVSIETNKDAIMNEEFRGQKWEHQKTRITAFRIDMNLVGDRCELCPA